MAEQSGNEEVLESSARTPDDVTKPQNNQQNNLKKSEDPSSNGTLPCSSFSASNKSSNVFRSSVLASGSPMSAFASSNFGNSSQNVGNSVLKNPFSLRPSVFDSVGSPSKSLAEKKPIILRASQLELSDSVLSNKTNNTDGVCILSPAKLNNPFSKSESRNEENNSPSKTSSINSEENKEIPGDPKQQNSSHISKVSQVSFVPLGVTTSSSTSGGSQAAQSSTTSTAPSFVFGQNLLDRVEVSNEAARANSETENSETAVSETNSCDGSSVNTNGATPEMLFSSVIQKELSDKQSDIGNEDKKRKTLTEAAREYEESRAIKRKYEEVAVKTGEEEEINVLQMNCKLFAFNKEKSTWVERGRGTLRLNDFMLDNRTQSRVVMRVSGSLRVVLNTKIWPEMAVVKPSEKSVRLTAMDSSGEIKVFLVMAGIKEIDNLFKALEWRVNNQKKLTTVSQKNDDLTKS